MFCKKAYPYYAFGGFHLYNPSNKTAESLEVVKQLASDLSVHEAVFYTGHCTGEKAFKCIRESMGENLQHISTGSVIEI